MARFLPPHRYVLAIMINVGIISSYLVRDSFYVVIRHISLANKTMLISEDDNPCNFTIVKKEKRDMSIEQFLDWKPSTIATMSHSFFVGYLVGHLPAGIISDKYGGKHIFGLSILLPGLLTLLVPFLITHLSGHLVVQIVRFLVGLLQGATFPAANSLMSNWAPKQDRGSVAGIVFAAPQFGTIINNAFTFRIMLVVWSGPFYIYGGMSVVWWVLWMLVGRSKPSLSPFVGCAERMYLERELTGCVDYKQKKFPWKRIITSVPLWAVVLVHAGHMWMWHFLLRELPNFTNNVLKFDMKTSPLVTSLPFGILGVLNILVGFTSDHLIFRGTITQDTSRKMLSTFGNMGPGIFTMTAAYCGCNRTSSVYLLGMAITLMSGYHAGNRIVTLDLAPNYSGVIMGLANGLGALSGIIQTSVLMEMLQPTTRYEWRTVFLISLLIMTVTNIFFVMFGTAKEQPWNYWKVETKETVTSNEQ